MLQVRENEISPLKWSGGSAHERTTGGDIACGAPDFRKSILFQRLNAIRAIGAALVDRTSEISQESSKDQKH